jgi:hypothetical protein
MTPQIERTFSKKTIMFCCEVAGVVIETNYLLAHNSLAKVRPGQLIYTVLFAFLAACGQ